MKFTAEQIEYLERVIEMQGLDITKVKTHIKGDVEGSVWGNLKGSVEGYVGGNVGSDVEGNVGGDVEGNVSGNVEGDVNGNVWGNVLGGVNGMGYRFVDTYDDMRGELLAECMLIATKRNQMIAVTKAA